MTRMHKLAGTLAAGTIFMTCAAVVQPDDGSPENSGLTVGVFDSRAIALAYVNSAPFKATMSGLHEDLAEAKASGNTDLVAELEAYGPRLQEHLHRQGFSTGSVTDILDRVRDELPALANRAGVAVIVSKWELAHRAPSVSVIDVTHLLVAEFEPDKRTTRMIAEMMEKEPLPLMTPHDH